MPTYDFRCPGCETTFEERRSFARADDPAVCPCCGDDHATKVSGSPSSTRPARPPNHCSIPVPARRRAARPILPPAPAARPSDR